MGLKTKNYVSKSTGVVLPEAYAVLKNLIIETDNRARAVFAIQASRENAQNYKAIDTHEIRFVWDRKTDPAKMAYALAKLQTEEIEKYDEDGNVSVETVQSLLNGWEDDIV